MCTIRIVGLWLVAMSLLVSSPAIAYRADDDREYAGDGDYDSGNQQEVVIHFSTWGKDKAEKEQFGYSRFEVSSIAARNELPGVVIKRGHQRVGDYNDVIVQNASGDMADYDLSNQRMHILAKKLNQGQAITFDDFCLQQRNAFRSVAQVRVKQAYRPKVVEKKRGARDK